MKTKRFLITLLSILVLIMPIYVSAEDEATITADSTSIKVEESTNIHTTCPDEYVASITSTSNASIDESGKVTGVSEGKATVTVTCTKEGETSKSASVEITINAKEEPETPQDPTPPPTPEPEKKINIDKVTLGGITADKASETSFTFNVNKNNENDFKTALKNIKKNMKIEPSNYEIVSNTDPDYKSKFQITVKDKETEKTKVFYFSIVYEKANVNLASLKISGYAFNQTFDKDTLSYTVTVPYDVREVTIYATPEDSNAKVSPGTTIERDDLEVGGNTITIKVTNGGESKTYRVFVTRSEDDSPENDGKPTSIIKTKITSTSGFDIPDTENPDSPLKIAIITLGAVILFLIGGCGIYFYFKTSPKRMKKELMKQKKKKVESPIVETPTKVEELEKTKEFKNL